MIKKAISRALIGIPIGIAIGYIMTIIASAIVGDGFYHAVMPELAVRLGGELKAVLIQIVVCSFYGIAFAGSSVIWEIDSWSLLKQTIVHMLIVSAVCFPSAWLMRWMPRNLSGIIGYVAIFFAIYAVIWLSTWLFIRHNLSKINSNMNKD